MADDVEITPRPNGPYLVKGPVRIVDQAAERAVQQAER